MDVQQKSKEIKNHTSSM